MSVVDVRRIENLEHLAQSLAARVDLLEHATVRPGEPIDVRPRRSRASSRQAAEPSLLPTVSLATPPATSEPESTATAVDAHDRLEDLLGGRMLAWLGGAAVLTGIALFFAYAISRGWIGESARVAAGGAVSLASLFFGIWLHEHRGRTDAARTVVAMAVAGLFITIVVASRVYAVIPVGVGFALALAAGVTGAALAVRWSAKVIAAMGIVGALLAPILVGAPDDGATLAILFASALSAVAVLLWRRWDWLGFAVLVACAPQWLGWIAQGPSLAGGLLVLFGFGALGHCAAIGFELRLPETKLRASSSLLLVLNAVVVAFAGYLALVGLGHPVAAGLWIAALAAIHLVLALLAGRLARVSADITLLLAALGVLLGDVAFALLAHGPVLAAGFAATSVVFARLAAQHAKRRHDHALAELGLGGHIAAALLVATGQAAAHGFLGQGGGGEIATSIALAAVAAAAFTSARLSTNSSRAWRTALNVLGLVVTAGLTAVNFGGAELTVAWAVEGVALAAITRRADNDGVAAVASLAFLAGATIYALAIEAAPRALVFGAPDLAAAAAAIGASAAASLLIARTRLVIGGRETAGALIGAALLALLYLASIAIITAFQPSGVESGGVLLALTVRQEGQMLLSCLWALVGVTALIVGLRRDRRLLRLGALGVLLVTAAKVFLYDLSTLDSGYRIGSLIALGLLLLLGAYAYQRLRPPPAPDFRTVPRALR